MAAFDRVLSGIPEMDAALDNIRLGDNVVWRVSDLEDFRTFVRPYVLQAVRDGRTIIYIRFAEHEPIIPLRWARDMGIHVENVELSHRFETFTVDVHQIIARYGLDAFYVFDCLSELQTAWSTDLMMGNFFKVTCPFLFQLDTVAYFPLIRGMHSLAAIDKIRGTAQVFLDVYADPGRTDRLYVRPGKVWRRSSDTMMYPHIFSRQKQTFRPVTDGVQTSRFYNIYEACQRPGEDQDTDFWDRFFRDTRRRFRDGYDVQAACDRMCRIMMSRDEHMRRLIHENFQPQDFFRVRDRMIGTGMIGGKACGMLTARKILQNREPDIYARLEPHDSYYIGSDVFYSYIVDNGFWDLRVEQRKPEGYFALADEFAEKLRSGKFDSRIEARFHFMLDSYGQDPYIVRSSSILEDGFGNAFAGKYESVFCVNSGTEEERLKELEQAVRIVYASTMSRSALDYRRRRGLDKRDEQMALLVQRVSGSRYNGYFMPCAAGVGYSTSPYRVRPDADPAAGMLRLVMGLGTAAVDRIEGSYPRIVGLDKPEITTASSDAERHKFSQRSVELIDRVKRKIIQVYPDTLLPLLPDYMKDALLDHDREAERRFRERGQNRKIYYVSCGGLVENKELMGCMRTMLRTIQDVYQYPVDIEYTIHIGDEGDFVINLLQCRPLQGLSDDGLGSRAALEPLREGEDVLLECRHASMGTSRKCKVDAIVYVDPEKYYRLPYANKPDIARLIGRINERLQKAAAGGSPLQAVLMVPGRVGTSSPELGVPASFADISAFSAICEIAESSIGYNPELSYGSHIFQDLVEMNILYAAVFEGATTLCYKPQLLAQRENDLPAVLPDAAQAGALADLIGVYGFSENFRRSFPGSAAGDAECLLCHDMKNEQLRISFRPAAPESGGRFEKDERSQNYSDSYL